MKQDSPNVLICPNNENLKIQNRNQTIITKLLKDVQKGMKKKKKSRKRKKCKKKNRKKKCKSKRKKSRKKNKRKKKKQRQSSHGNDYADNVVEVLSTEWKNAYP